MKDIPNRVLKVEGEFHLLSSFEREVRSYGGLVENSASER